MGSFLTKDLGIDWRWGERWFMRYLLDGDEASNNGNWQWIASGCTIGRDYPEPIVDHAEARRRIFGALGLADNAGQAVGMVAAGALTGPLGLGAILDVQAGIYLATGLLAVRALEGATGARPPQPVCVSVAPVGRPK